MKYKTIYFAISGVFLIAGIASLIIWGLKPSIDFTGGSLLEVELSENIGEDQIRMAIDTFENVDVSSIQKVTDRNSYVIRMNPIDEVQKNELIRQFEGNDGPVTEVRFETVGPTLGRELLIKTTVAILIASILILSYVAYQFKDRIYGAAAILAMFHDTLILIGAFSIFGHFFNVEIDTLFVTAVLTTLSFSVHDTIVVFDRIRESLKTNKRASFEDLINQAVTETLARSLNNSMTIIFMLTALALLGGITIKWFVIALLIGTISGTYSSTFTAAPILLILTKRFRKN